MKDLNKAADNIVNLYDGRAKRGETAKCTFELVKRFINESKEFTLHEKAQLEIFNIECLENCNE